MGFTLDRNTRIFYAWKCLRRFDIHKNLGGCTSAGTYRLSVFYFNGNFTDCSAFVAYINSRRQYGVEFFSASAGLFASCDSCNDVFIFQKDSAESHTGEVNF